MYDTIVILSDAAIGSTRPANRRTPKGKGPWSSMNGLGVPPKRLSDLYVCYNRLP